MRKKPTRKRPYFKMEFAMTAILRDVSGKMHHGILFDLLCVKAKLSELKAINTWVEGVRSGFSLSCDMLQFIAR